MLGVNDYIQLLIGILSLIPTYYLFRNYKKTRLIEFLFFGFTFLIGTINQFSYVLYRQEIFKNTFLIGISYMGIMFTYGMVVGVLKYENPRNWFNFIIIATFISFIILLFLNLIFPNNSVLSFFYNEEIANETSPFPIISQLYRIFIFGFGVYVMKTSELPSQTKSYIRYRNIMIVGGSLFIVYPIIILANISFQYNISIFIARIFNLFTMMVWGTIALRAPEALVLTHTPVVRANNLYRKLKSFTDKETKEFGMDSLVKYIKSIPIDVINRK